MDMIPVSIGINDFVRRQTKDSKYSHFEGSLEMLIDIVKISIEKGFVKDGYRSGVLVVNVPPHSFRSSIKKLKVGDKLSATFSSRRPEEEPYIQVNAIGEKVQALKAEVILYSKSVLAENKENSTNCDYEIVCINATPDDEDPPMAPSTYARNILQNTGGTSANLEEKTKEQLAEFIKDIAKSIEYWGRRAMMVSGG